MEGSGRVDGTRVALLIEDGFDEAELADMATALSAQGVLVTMVAPWAGRPFTGKGGTVTVTSDLAAGAATVEQFDALVIPGGFAPDRIRMRHAMVDLARHMLAAGKPVAAIARGPQVLISANVLRGRTLTCWPSIAIDVTNAGGLYVDRPVVVDANLITSRKMDDVPVFIGAVLRALGRAPTGETSRSVSETTKP
jgi:protease I